MAGMRRLVAGVLTAFVWTTLTGSAQAHHSFAMFDTEHPIEIAGTVKEFKWVSPHSILIVEVRSEDGTVKNWTLEGDAPSLLRRQGTTATSLKPGDEVVVTVSPLHSGAAGGLFRARQVKFKDGRPLVLAQ
jgi:hypothetical protein